MTVDPEEEVLPLSKYFLQLRITYLEATAGSTILAAVWLAVQYVKYCEEQRIV